jgi:hypothetical protein
VIRLTRVRILSITTVVAILLSLRSVASYLFVDRCLDLGGMMNYDEWYCSMSAGAANQNPVTGTWLRAPSWIGVATAAFAVIVLLAAFAAFDRWRRRSSPPAA